MKLTLRTFLFLIFHFLFLTSNAQNPKFELRAAWIATVVNIDWPSKKGLSTEEQKSEFIKLLNMLQHVGMNAIVVQVRPAGDAFYPSQYEPWSEFLTGVQGQAPSPYYDPLQFMIAETHKRGMEFHAWFNPYRAVFDVNRSSVAATHPTKIYKNWFLTYGGGGAGVKKYFDPGNPDVRQFLLKVIKDVVKRYNIDAVHFDDYFYPYPVAGKEFPDDESYSRYGKGMEKNEWRRSNCDSIIRQLSTMIKSVKPNVKFGISPFGVWRNKSKDSTGSPTKTGITNYDDLHADILLWLKKGWIDYVTPQCYWEIGKPNLDFGDLVDWWASHTYGRQLFIGHALERAGSNAAWRNKKELPNEIEILRDYENVQGSMFFSAKHFYRNPNGWSDSLRLHYYNTPALIPPMKWIDSIPPIPPMTSTKKNKLMVNKQKDCEPLKGFVLYAFSKDSVDIDDPKNIVRFYPATNDQFEIDNFEVLKKLYANKVFGVTAIDINNNESELVLVK